MIRGITTCKLCGKEFSGPLYKSIGEGKHADLIRYMNEVQQHLATKHPAENSATENRSLEFLTMLRLMNFKTTDSELTDQVQFLRWQIHQQVIPIRLRDERLHEMAQEYAAAIVNDGFTMLFFNLGGSFGVSTERLEAIKKAMCENIAAKTVATMGSLRDLYEEPGRYNIEVVPIEKSDSKPETPEKAPAKPLLIVP
jgi:L-alanine-DL-glutamate epimerase-like enolase superfamily enzyme